MYVILFETTDKDVSFMSAPLEDWRGMQQLNMCCLVTKLPCLNFTVLNAGWPMAITEASEVMALQRRICVESCGATQKQNII